MSAALLIFWLLFAHAWGWILCGLLALRRDRRRRRNHAEQMENVRAANHRLQHALERSTRSAAHLRGLR